MGVVTAKQGGAVSGSRRQQENPWQVAIKHQRGDRDRDTGPQRTIRDES